MKFLEQADIERFDSLNMWKVLSDFPNQIEEGIEIGRNAPLFKSSVVPKKIAILGMGGSAIGGDLLRSYSQATKGADDIHFYINRSYELPGFIDESWFVIASSYSGGTEETLAGYEEAKKRTKNLLVISSGGELANSAKSDGTPVINIPSGLMPRCALGYSFFALLFQVMRISAYDKNAVQETSEAIYETLDLLKKRSLEFSTLNEKNQSLQLAYKLQGKAVAVYSAESRLDVVNLRWRGQIQENAKQIAFGGYLPEMNHNEINSWSYPKGMSKQFAILLLQDINDHSRTQIRFSALQELLKSDIGDIIPLKGEGKHLLTRIFDLIYLGDWTSYWLALINGTDPTPIPIISKLKGILS